jgi:hypothetical protein
VFDILEVLMGPEPGPALLTETGEKTGMGEGNPTSRPQAIDKQVRAVGTC